MPPTYFFVIDVSYYSVSSGMLQTLAETVKNTLDSLPDTERTNVGFITFDSSVHFYNLKVTVTSISTHFYWEPISYFLHFSHPSPNQGCWSFLT